MDKTTVLCHINKKNLQLWENTGISSKILLNFISYLNELKSDIALCFETESEVSKTISSGLTSRYTTIPYSHEIQLIKNIFNDKNISSVYYLDSIFGIPDLVLTGKLFDIHNEYSADYSFIENAPPGLTGVFFNRSLFEAMQLEKSEKSDTGETENTIPNSLPVPLREYIEKNINHFHVEIHYEHPDLRILRLDYSGKTARSIQSVGEVFEKCGEVKDYYIELEGIYKKEPGLLRHFPSYIEVEIFGDCKYACSFCPRQFTDNLNSHSLTLQDIQKVIDYAKTGFDDTCISLGGLGEPLEHPEIIKILEKLLSEDSIPMVILETNGRYLDNLFNNKDSSILNHPELKKLRIVVNINSLKNYETLHGVKTEDKNAVLENLQKCAMEFKTRDKFLAKNIFIQTLKILDNENDLDEIYDLADKTGISFLLQKYNSWAGLMPEKRVSDMTPLERFFCWHLRRDLYIRANGNVAFCKQDIQNQRTRGNIKKDSLEKIWDTGKKDWVENYTRQYAETPDCAKCDEYYTFNM